MIDLDEVQRECIEAADMVPGTPLCIVADKLEDAGDPMVVLARWAEKQIAARRKP